MLRHLTDRRESEGVTKLLLLDRDGVINQKPTQARYLRSWGEFIFMESTLEALHLLSARGFEFIVISNQAGIHRGVMSAEAVLDIHQNLYEILEKEGIIIRQIYVCPHRPEENCECRKPKPGMLLQAAKDYQLSLESLFFVGDNPTDCQAAYHAGCQSIYIGAPQELSILKPHEAPQLVVKTLLEALPDISPDLTA